jgi:hypothetical protein
MAGITSAWPKTFVDIHGHRKPVNLSGAALKTTATHARPDSAFPSTGTLTANAVLQ